MVAVQSPPLDVFAACAACADVFLAVTVLYIGLLRNNTITRRSQQQQHPRTLTEVTLKTIYVFSALGARLGYLGPNRVRAHINTAALRSAAVGALQQAGSIVPNDILHHIGRVMTAKVTHERQQRDQEEHILRLVSCCLSLLSLAIVFALLDAPRRRVANVCYISLALNAWTLSALHPGVNETLHTVVATLASYYNYGQIASEEGLHRAICTAIALALSYALIG